MRYKNLIVIGSSHVSQQSIDLVRKTIQKEKPGIVAIELDKDRLHALLTKKKGSRFIRGVGFKGMVFAAVGEWVERKIGTIVKVEPGSEMKEAFMLAKEQKAKVALIDQHITITLRRFSQTLTWKEKWRIFADIVLGIVTPKRQMKKLRINPESVYNVPDEKTLKQLLLFVKKRYPNMYAVLVDERNAVMATNLAHIMKHYPDETIVAVVGAGHEEGIMKLLKDKIYKQTTA